MNLSAPCSRISDRTGVREGLLDGLPPPAEYSLDAWALEYCTISGEESADPGRYRYDDAPYQRGILAAVTAPGVTDVVLMTSSQVGKTQIMKCIMAYFMAHDPAPILAVLPTVEIAEAFSRDRLAPMLRDTPVLQGLVHSAKARDSGNTLTHKRFAGGHLTLSGANSPSSLASRPIRVLLCDEVDRYPVSAGTEGDPLRLAQARTKRFWNALRFKASSPGAKGASRIEREWERSDQCRFYVPCPDCGHAQTLKWANVVWDKEYDSDGRVSRHDPDSALYACEACGSLWDDSKRWRAIRDAEIDGGGWRADRPEVVTVRGFHLNELYSPVAHLATVVADFLESKDYPDTLKTWVNTSLGEPFEHTGEGVNANRLMERRESYGLDLLPTGVCLITAGIDIQRDRVEIELVGWGRGEECWSLDYQVIYGDPHQSDIWSMIEDYCRRTYPHPCGRSLRIAAVCLDASDGETMTPVLSYTRPRLKQRVYAVKGVSGPRPIWTARPATSKKVSGAKLFAVGVDPAKDQLYARLSIEEPGPGYCHFPDQEGYDERYFNGLVAERVVTERVNGVPRRKWYLPAGRRNEPLDCRVYAIAALHSMPVQLDVLADQIDAMTSQPQGAGTQQTPSAPQRMTRRRRGVRSPGIG